MQHISWRLLSFILVLFLAACGGADNQVVEPKLAEPILTPSSTGSATLRLANQGGAPLIFEVKSGDERVAISPQRGRLDANQARVLEVSATCNAGTLESTLTVISNDVAAPSKTLPLSLKCGAAAGPVWWLSAHTVTVNGYGETDDELETTLSAQEVTRQVTLSNSGRMGSDYTLSSNQSWLSTVRSSGTLGAGESDTLELTVRPCTQATRDQAELTVSGGGHSVTLSVVRDCDIANAATLDLKFERFYINQSVPAADSSRPPHERRALIASRGGLARAFVQANQFNDRAVTVRLHYKNAGEEGYIDLTGPANVPTQSDEGDLGSTFNTMLDEALLTPELKIAVEIDPENRVAERNEANNRYPASGFVSLEVVHAPTLNLTLIPVHYQGRTPELDQAAQEALLAQTRLLYPLSTINVTVHAPYTFSGTLEARDGGGWNKLLTQLADLRILDNSLDLYYGVVDPGYNSGIAGVGRVGGSPISVGWNNLPSRSTVMAHELGHNWKRNHAPCNVHGDKDYPHEEGQIGVWGFDSSTHTLKAPGGNADIMGYCNPAWISDYTYDGILEYRQDHAYSVQNSLQTQSLPTDALIVSGSVERGAVTLNPVFQAKVSPSTPTPGPYTLIGTDSAGRTLFNVPFSSQAVADLPEGSVSGFNLAVPLSAEEASTLTSLRVERGGTVLAEQSTEQAGLRTQSAQKTEIKRLGSKLTLTWDASTYDAVMVRDAEGSVLAVDERGEVLLETEGERLELTFSSGLRSHQEVVTF